MLSICHPFGVFMDSISSIHHSSFFPFIRAYLCNPWLKTIKTFFRVIRAFRGKLLCLQIKLSLYVALSGLFLFFDYYMEGKPPCLVYATPSGFLWIASPQFIILHFSPLSVLICVIRG